MLPEHTALQQSDLTETTKDMDEEISASISSEKGVLRPDAHGLQIFIGTWNMNGRVGRRMSVEDV
jgi:hypothetical protein